MGNNHGKKECGSACDIKLDESFASLSNNALTISYYNLKKSWSPQLDCYLYEGMEAYLRKKCRNELNKQVFKDFYFGLCKVDVEEKSKNLMRLISDSDHVSEQKLLQFITAIIKSVLIIQQVKSVKSFNSWASRASDKCNNDSIGIYARYFLSLLNKKNETEYNAEDMRNLLTYFEYFFSMIMNSIYKTEEYEYFSHFFPKWKQEAIDSDKNIEDVSILDLIQIIFINMELPIDCQNEWRLLFSSSINGESFSRLSGQIINKGPTVIIVKDKNGNIFGGFAPQTWNFGPNFVGDSSSFLFTLLPEMKVFPSSGFNSNFQYMNVGQQTMPNGLGMGGKLEYFGMWLSANYGSGHCSESCTTYRNYHMMSSTKEFSLSHLEVWGVGLPPVRATELGERSCLDGNIEAKAILEMAGKSTFSEGYREKPED